MFKVFNLHSLGFHQVWRTIIFELKRNTQKFFIMCAINSILVGLFYLINYFLDVHVTKASSYILTYLAMISWLIMIIGVTFGSSIIVEDFEKNTGNLLFPKIERGRLLVGRYCAHYFYASLSLCVFYFEIMVITILNYDYIPEIIWESLGWALLYLHLVLSFCVLISALMKRVSEATILSLFFFLLIFTSFTSLLKYTESTIEPLFIPDYYANIITACFDMPRVRFTEMQLGRHGDHRIVLAWATPSIEGALIGMILYSSLLLFIAYLLYRRKQMHN